MSNMPLAKSDFHMQKQYKHASRTHLEPDPETQNPNREKGGEKHVEECQYTFHKEIQSTLYAAVVYTLPVSFATKIWRERMFDPDLTLKHQRLKNKFFHVIA